MGTGAVGSPSGAVGEAGPLNGTSVSNGPNGPDGANGSDAGPDWPPSWRIVPFEGLAGLAGLEQLIPDGVRFGEHRRVLTDRFGEAFGHQLGERRTFRKAPWSTGLCDHYVDGGLILFFDAGERLVHCEVHDPAPLRHRGVDLLERPYGEVLADLRAVGCRLVGNDVGASVPDDGVHLVAGDPDAPEEPVRSVALSARTYACGDGPGTGPGAGPVMSDEPRVPPVSEHHLVPGAGTGDVQLGQDRFALRATLGPAMQSVPGHGGASEDWYHEHGLVLTFDAEDRLTTLAVSYVGREGRAWLSGVQLLGRPYEDVVGDLQEQGIRVEPGELAARLPDHGFTLLLRGYGNPAMPVGAVLATARGAA